MSTIQHHSKIERSGRISAILAIACAIHCALMPLLISVLPLLGMQFMGSHAFEIGMMGLGIGFGIYGVARAYQRHRRWLPSQIVASGSLFVVIGLFFAPEAIEPFFVSSGAVMIGIAQIVNIRFTRSCSTCQA